VIHDVKSDKDGVKVKDQANVEKEGEVQGEVHVDTQREVDVRKESEVQDEIHVDT